VPGTAGQREHQLTRLRVVPDPLRCQPVGGVEVPGRLGVAAALRLRQDRARSKCSAASFTAMMAREHTRSGSGPGELALQALLGRWENR